MPSFPEVQQLQGDGVSLGVQGGMDGASTRWWQVPLGGWGISGGVGSSSGFRSFEMVTI